MEFFQEPPPDNKNTTPLEEDLIDLSNSQDLDSNLQSPRYDDLKDRTNASYRLQNAGNELKELKNAYQDILLHTFEIISQQKQALESKEAFIQYQTQLIDQKNIEIAELKEQLLPQQTNERSIGSFLQGKDFTKRPLDFDQGMDSLALSMVSSPKSKLTAFNTPMPIEKLVEVESPMPDIILESLEDLKKDEVILSQELIQLEKALIKMKPIVASNNKSQSGLEMKKTPNPSTSYSNLKLWKQQKQAERELDVDKEIENTEKELGYDDFFADSFCIKKTIKPPAPSIPILSKKFDFKVAPVDSKLRVRTEESKSRAVTVQSRSPEVSKRGKVKKENNNDLQSLDLSKEQKSSKEENKNTSLGKPIIPFGYYNYSNLMPNKSDKAGKIIHLSKSQILQNIQDSSNKIADSLNVTITKSSPLVDKDRLGGVINLSRGKNPIKERNPDPKLNISQRTKTENSSARGNSSQIRERKDTFESLAQENSELYRDIEVLTTTSNKNIFRNLLSQAGFGVFPSSPTLPNKSTIKVSQSYNFADSSFPNKEIILNLDLSSTNIRSSGQVSLRSKQDSTRQGDRKPKVPNFNEYQMRDVHGRKFVLRDKTNDENVNKSVQLLRNGGFEEEKLAAVVIAGKKAREGKSVEKPVISEINFAKLKNPQSLLRKKTN